MNDEYYMRRALRLARRGLGRTSPNPMVGAVIVREGRIIGEGYHHYFGGDHAEVDALRHAREAVSGATIYVTLEPCSHYGKTPPCVEALIEHRLGEVVAGTLDPNPLVGGQGLATLRGHGIPVRVGLLAEECYRLNVAYFKYVQTRTPFVTVKLAQTLDGRIATTTGSSRWITSEPSRKLVHRLRATHDAVLVGLETVLADQPELTVRLVKGRDPLRVVLDSRLRIPSDARVLQGRSASRTLVATTTRASPDDIARVRATGAVVLPLPPDDRGRVDLNALLKDLGERGIASLLVEGGAATATSFLARGLVDRLVLLMAPRILGKGIEAVGDLGIRDVNQALQVSLVRTYRSGPDLVIEAAFDRPELRAFLASSV